MCPALILLPFPFTLIHIFVKLHLFFNSRLLRSTVSICPVAVRQEFAGKERNKAEMGNIVQLNKTCKYKFMFFARYMLLYWVVKLYEQTGNLDSSGEGSCR